jgi:hypothetical protein
VKSDAYTDDAGAKDQRVSDGCAWQAPP